MGRHFIDTARNYGSAAAEERIGAAIRERGGLPEGFIISTKLDRDFRDERVRRLPRPPLARAKPEGAGDRPDSTSCICTIPSTPAPSNRRRRKTGALGELFRIKEEGWRRRSASRPARRP